MKSLKNKECPICGFVTLRSDREHSICAICMWEDDLVQARYPDYEDGANYMSLNEYRKRWQNAHKRVGVVNREKTAA